MGNAPASKKGDPADGKMADDSTVKQQTNIQYCLFRWSVFNKFL